MKKKDLSPTLPELPEIDPEILETLLGLSDIDRKNFECDWKAQKVANKNATDAVLVTKIDTLLTVLESPHFEPTFKELYWRKMDELVRRL